MFLTELIKKIYTPEFAEYLFFLTAGWLKQKKNFLLKEYFEIF